MLPQYTYINILWNICHCHSRIYVFLFPFMSFYQQEKGQPLPKFGEWDVNDPASAEGFTVIFNKARNEKKTGGNPESPTKADSNIKQAADPFKPQAVS